MNVNDKPTVKQQGLIVAEVDDDGFLVMFPDGEVKHFSHRGKVESAARKWLSDHLGDQRAIGIGRIEWRGLR